MTSRVKLPLKPLLLVLGLAATAYALALLFTNEQPLAALVQRLLSPAGLAAALLCTLNYLLRGLRWRLWMAHYGRRFGLAEGLRLYLAGYTFTPTPANVGEAARGLLLARQPLAPLQSLALFGAERVADLLGLLLLAVPGAVWLLSHLSLRWSPLWLGLALLLALLLAALGWRLFGRRLLGAPWLQDAWQCLTRHPLRWLALTVPAWAAQGLAVWLLCRQQGLAIDPLLASGFYALAMVGGALSMLPAGLGGTEALLTGLLLAAGADLGAATAITVLARLLTLWLAVAIGAAALLYSAAFRRDIALR